MAHPTEFVVGIDLGTTNSSVAVVQDGKVVVIPVNGHSSMPSAVGLDPSGKLMIGQAAKNQAVSAPENTVLSIKRLMGTDETVTLGGKSYRPEEISALILAELRRAAEQYLGVPVSKAVITVPAFFNEIQRHATQDAGKLAGLEVLRIINEPTAAALAYGAGQAGSANLETLLVYDLGGGTFDVSVVSVEDGVVEVRSSHGDIHLGGDDFDAALADYAVKQILTKDGITPLLQPAATRRLKSVMESAKIALSDAPFTQVREEYITPDTHLDAEISRSDYESLVEPFIQKTLDCLQQSLADAKVTAAQLSKVMLVGGATRTPLVQMILETKLGIEPRHEIDPDLVVTMGAAIQGAALAGVESPAVLVDITAHTYSLETLSGDGLFSMELICVPIIRRGSALPITKAEVFDTIRDNQEMVQLNVYQGESSEPTENLKIGEFVISGLSQVPSGNLILVQYSIDLNGLLTVTATEKSTGLVKSVTIDTAGQHRINLDAARTNLAELLETQDDDATRIRFDETDAELSETITVDVDDDSPSVEPQSHAAFSKSAIQQLLASAKQLRHRADGLLALPISESDRHQLREILDAIGRSIQSRDWATLQSLLDSLSDLLFYLED